MEDIELRWVMYEGSDARHLQYRFEREEPDPFTSSGWRDVPTVLMERPDNG